MRLGLAWPGLPSSLTQTASSHLQLQGSWEAVLLSSNNNKTKTAGYSTLQGITDTGGGHSAIENMLIRHNPPDKVSGKIDVSDEREIIRFELKHCP